MAAWGPRGCLFAGGCWLFAAAVAAQTVGAPAPARGTNCLGSFELAGGHLGCHAFDETAVSIPLAQCNFTDVPSFTAYGNHEGPGEHVYLRLMGVDKVAATVRVTTASIDSHQVCGRTTIEWEAHQ